MQSACSISVRIFASTAIFSVMMIAGCRSANVQSTVVNSGTATLRNIEVDYPSASFGAPTLAPGETFRYKFQLQDAGRIKVQFEDSTGKPHAATGPYAKQGQHGTLRIVLNGSGKVLWAANLQPLAAAPARN